MKGSWSAGDCFVQGQDQDIRSPRPLQRSLVSFQAKVRTEWGDTVVLVGSSAELGKWDPHRGLHMRTDEDSYPFWRLEVKLGLAGPIGEAHEFKLVVLRASGQMEWEPLAANRHLVHHIAPDCQMYVACEWGCSPCDTCLAPCGSTIRDAFNGDHNCSYPCLTGEPMPDLRNMYSSSPSWSTESSPYSQSITAPYCRQAAPLFELPPALQSPSLDETCTPPPLQSPPDWTPDCKPRFFPWEAEQISLASAPLDVIASVGNVSWPPSPRSSLSGTEAKPDRST